MTTPVFLLTELTDNQASPYATVNEALRVIEAHTRVTTKSTAAQPGSVTNGAAYILPASPSGTLWATFAEDDLVIGIGGTWKKYTPLEGWRVWVNDLDSTFVFDGSNWIPETNSLMATGAAAPTIASSTTIAPTKAITFISGTTDVVTITAPEPIASGGGQIVLIPTGLFSTTTAGNIAIATTAVVSKALTMTYDTTTTKWYPSY